MNVLIGCENSGVVRDAFIARGHNAVSCDLLPSDRPGPHYKGDIRDMLNTLCKWDLFICHPDCTYLCRSGLHWNKKRPGRDQLTLGGLEFVREMMNAPVDKIVIENPPGRIGTAIRKADQYIQPYDFGHNASKKTGLWLKGVDPLVIDQSHYFEPRIVEYPPGSGKMVKRWGNQTDSGQNALPPSPDRWKLRAETYQGCADAMAEQWG